ncbi:MAG: anhydro-N-acetylmuramic acid kinase [Chitinophagaceae bacterium]|jgi:anhydro-N-acetylmuramic acid kinase|nr:anhydro-N-acetylmuramic acid kinase [Chitinophagaceae bacterium]
MTYKVIGLMSGSSLDGLDIVFAELVFDGKKWQYEILVADCLPYSDDWINKLQNATRLNAYDYMLLHADYGHYLGQQVNQFIETNNLHYKVSLIASHGHTTFHDPSKKMTAQLGDGAAIAAITQLPVVSDLRALDVAFGGQGAPIVPIGEKWLLGDHAFFLNLGGIANISFNNDAEYLAFDVCPANRVLNMLSANAGKIFDEGGQMAASGNINQALFDQLNELDYYRQPFPKSLANDFGTNIVYPMIKKSGCSVPDALRTMTEHIAFQIKKSVEELITRQPAQNKSLLATGGGAHNQFLIEKLREHLSSINIDVVIPDVQLINYKEALVMAFIGVLRWRQENNILHTVTGASRDSIGGALWIGQQA